MNFPNIVQGEPLNGHKYKHGRRHSKQKNTNKEMGELESMIDKMTRVSVNVKRLLNQVKQSDSKPNYTSKNFRRRSIGETAQYSNFKFNEETKVGTGRRKSCEPRLGIHGEHFWWQGRKSLIYNPPNNEHISAVSIRGVKPRHLSYPNQDVFNIVPTPEHSSTLYIVCDGHGKFGHLVSEYAMNSLIEQIVPKIADISNLHPREITKIHTNIYQKVMNELETETNIDTSFSGTTVSIMLQIRDKLIVSHCGDSRMVIAKREKNGLVSAVELSKDHKPDDKREYQRIMQCGGYVTPAPLDPYGNAIGSSRVWKRDARAPGLAMSRSLGDSVAHEVGVSSVPDVSCIRLEKTDLFAIVASDGLWEFISNQEAIDIAYAAASTSQMHGIMEQKGMVERSFDARAAVERLCQVASSRWKHFSDNTTIDDITIIVTKFDIEGLEN